MRTYNEVSEDICSKYGFASMLVLIKECWCEKVREIAAEIALAYAREALEEAAKQAKVRIIDTFTRDGYEPEVYVVKESITGIELE